MKPTPDISVCIFTLNPNPDLFRQVIQGLRNQTFELSRYEIVIVDNGSLHPVSEIFYQDLKWHPSVTFSVESQRGFAYANRRLFEEAKSDIIVILGDDCILAPDYLAQVHSIFSEHPDVGVLTGSVKFECSSKTEKFSKYLHDRVYFGGNFSGYVETQIKTRFTVAMRGSAGMALRSDVGKAFLQRFWIYPEMMAALQSANLPFNLHFEDLDLAMYALHMNYKIARSGELQLTHITFGKEMNPRLLLKREYLAGFFMEFFYMRWNWYPYSQSLREWGRLLNLSIYPIFPIVLWLGHFSQLWGRLKARWFIINHQNLLLKVSIKQK